MMVTVESWLRRGVLWGKRIWTVPWVQPGVRGLWWCLRGLAASLAGLRGWPQPLVLGVILTARPWQAMLSALGAGLGFRLLWGQPGTMGLWWCLGGLVLALLNLGGCRWLAAGALTAAVGLWLRFGTSSGPGPVTAVLQTGLAGVSVFLFSRQDRVARWLRYLLWGLALARIPAVGFGFCAAVAVAGSFPAAVLAGTGMDLARVTALPVAGAVALSWLTRYLAPRARLRFLLPLGVLACVSFCLGLWELPALGAMALGGLVGLVLPREQRIPRTGGTAGAQVRLELASQTLLTLQQSMLALTPPSIDREALLQRTRNRACAGCSARRGCLEQDRLTITALEDTRDFACRKPGRLRPELQRSRDQLRLLKANARRREEYRQAITGQYLRLGEYLRLLADRLPREQPPGKERYGMTLGVRTRGSRLTNGDRWAAFPGEGASYYLVLCDGMGTGPGAQEEGRQALQLLRGLLTASFPPEGALGTLNDQLALTGRAGAVTVDLVWIRLDTGAIRLYKWGAAPSWRVRAGHAEKLGEGAAPPGMAVGDRGLRRLRVNLGPGELLILASDGVDGEDLPRRVRLAPGAPPGILAQRLLEGDNQDDATAAVLRLYRRG